MARIQRKTVGIIAVIVLVIVLLVALAILLTKKNDQPSSTATQTSSQQPTPSKNTTTETDSTETPSTSAPTTPAADPSTLNSVDIDPLGIKVFYTKGTPGFEYAIKKAADNTQYIEFTSSDLVGTKCTDDNGMFATITKNPSSSESQTTISQTVKVGQDSYGLSLASASCTGNVALLGQYQDGFKNGFSSLTNL